MVYLLYQYVVPTHPFEPILSGRHVINKDNIPNQKKNTANETLIVSFYFCNILPRQQHIRHQTHYPKNYINNCLQAVNHQSHRSCNAS